MGSQAMMNPLDPEEFRRQAHVVVDFLADYYSNIENYPVCSQVEPGYLTKTMPQSAPLQPQPIETILQDVQKHIIPGLTHWQSPGFFAYFQSNASTGNFLGEMLLTGFNSVGFNWLASPAATELEMVVMEWLLKLLQLPKSFSFSSNGGGVIHGSTCESFVCTLVAAREKKLSQREADLGKLVVYCSDQTHFSLQKACRVVGISPNNVRSIQTKKSMNFQLSPDALLTAIESDVRAGLIPLYVCLTLGTTSTTAVDPLLALSEIAKRFLMWVHVDAAYAGSACICPEFRHFLDGVEGANSFSFNPHKWFLTTLDCCCLWVKDQTDLTKALSNDPELLKNKASDTKNVVDYKDWQIALSRRFRAMKLWMVIRSYGVTGLQEVIRKHVKLAKHFEALLIADKRFEVVVPRNFATMCFKVLAPNGSNEDSKRLTQTLLDSLNASGLVYMTHAVIEGVYVIRVAIGATLTEDKHVRMLWDMVQEHATHLLASCADIQ
ncbi:putative pyridoxal phosphate-dependent decarboxylase, pyridoxal phosphate-dependent transferase [Helianthus annuus]|nr:putative pyridoxal phosphate-dependent decarboxylase, pyridoxal phosphate-dependent transferase [Helianthus annuus]